MAPNAAPASPTRTGSNSNSNSNSSNNNGSPEDDTVRYAVDIRVFLITIALSMAGAFALGVALGDTQWTQLALPQKLATANANSNNAMRVRDYLNIDAATEKSQSEHLPAGQHLLVDLENVDGEFLNSEPRLSHAMVETVRQAGLTMLSYHCHSLIPQGVSCVGVLLESHISFHTWPDDGVITLDLFTCGSQPLLPVIPVIEELFGVGDEARAQWSHELRGFRSKDEKHYLDGNSDLSLWVLSPLEVHSKQQIYSNLTKYQRIDIWDIVDITDTPSHQDVIKHNLTAGDPRLLTPELATPERLFFLDGTLQSIYLSEHVYHEALVQPAMFAHPAPRRVAIVGGGEGATLREVLKHKTVDQAIMIELDAELVQIAREFLPKMSDCSQYVGLAENCFDDEKTLMQYQDGRSWFVDHFGPKAESNSEKTEPLDVVIVDALDPEEGTEIANQLYSDENFIDGLMNSLSDEGVLAIQVGTAATIDDPKPDVGIYQNRERLFRMLEAHPKVEAMLVYEEAHCGFLEPHSFLLVCKSANCRSRWYARADQVDYEIYDRIVRMKNDDAADRDKSIPKRALQFYDGTTQRSYQWPKKGWETVYCRREPMPVECDYRAIPFEAELHDLDLEDPEKSSFRIETTTDETSGEITETKVLATVPIPKGSFVMPTHLASSLAVTKRNLDGLRENVQVGEGATGRVAILEDLLGFFDNYAHSSQAPGSHQKYVEVGGSVLMRSVAPEEANVEPWRPHQSVRPKYSPVYERHRVSLDVLLVATEDIPVGGEVLRSQQLWE